MARLHLMEEEESLHLMKRVRPFETFERSVAGEKMGAPDVEFEMRRMLSESTYLTCRWTLNFDEKGLLLTGAFWHLISFFSWIYIILMNDFC